MADSVYKPVEYVYKSAGLIARDVPDEAPPYTYLLNMNILERAENSVSSRFGYTIVNRDASGAGTNNYYFSAAVTSLAKMNFQGSPQRYAGLADGSLWQRNSNQQGQYTQIYTGLSGNPFETVISSCYSTALPFLFIADSELSIKVAAGSSTPQLWGIDPPDYTANAVPFSPLLTLIDNFSASNSYSVSGFESGWSYGFITNIPAGGASIVTDFPQFTNLAGTIYSLTPQGIGTAASGGTNSQTLVLTGGFPSEVLSPGETAQMSVTVQAQFEFSGGATGTGMAVFSSSNDGGTTWTPFYSYTESNGAQGIETTAGPNSVSFTVPGVTNLNQVKVRVVVTASETSGIVGSSLTVTGNYTLAQGSISATGIFGEVCNGILSVLNSKSVVSVPIVSIAASGMVGDVYTTLTITTAAPHGASTGQNISVYGSSNDLADGFYPATVLSSNSLTVPFLSPVGYPVPISGTGGSLQYVSASSGPNTAVLTNEYSTPYPAQFSAWGFYQQVQLSASSFPIGCWSGEVSASSTATVGVTANFDLSINNQVTDSDLIVLTLQVGSPQNIANIRLQFDVNGSGYTSSYYYANISPSYYQGNIANLQSAYNTTQNQILADALGLITGQPESSTTAQLQPSNFSTGESAWAAVLIPRGNFLPVGSAGQSGLDWTNITGWQVVIEAATTGASAVAMNGLYLQWGYGPSSFAGIGYDYRYTYYNLATGTESSPAPEMEFNQQYGYLSSLVAPFYLRQAVNVSGFYSTDPQVTHYRVYRRGGIYANNWLLIDQIPNVTGGGAFQYKDVVPDASLAQAQPLVLDNDPPVTSSLVNPVLATLLQATTGPGNSVYSTYVPQIVIIPGGFGAMKLYQNQTVLIGNAYNLEEVLLTSDSVTVDVGFHIQIHFQAIVRLQHNAGEQVQINSTPRAKCNLCATVNLPGGATQVIVAGDQSNPGRVYYAKPNLPENFGPENYVDAPNPNDPVMALINWRGTAFAATQATWYVFVGGAQPYLQPTGATHGLIASQGWTLAEGVIPFRSSDGWRFFSGADGKYMTLPVEWIFRTNPMCLPPQVSASGAPLDVFGFFNNCVFGSYISLSGERYRLVYDLNYNRFRQDDIAATAMLWERDTNVLLCGVAMSASTYAVVEDQQYNQDYDDGGWANGALVQTPININIQTPYRDLGRPHFPKQWNVLETDVNTANQNLQTTLLFDTEPPLSIVLPTVNSGTQREKVQLQINDGDGQQSYSMSIQHTMAVTVAPTLYQENIYAAILADYRSSFDSYWQKASIDELKLWKEGYFDYSATEDVAFSLYQNGDTSFPYFTFTLPAQENRSVVRVLFPALKSRLWRMVGVSTGDFQLWAPVQIDSKPLLEGSAYERVTYGVYE